MATEKERLEILRQINELEQKLQNNGRLGVRQQEKLTELKKEQLAINKDLAKIRASEAGIQKRINQNIKDQKNFYGDLVKGALKLDLSSISQTLNKRALTEETEKNISLQEKLSNVLSKAQEAGDIEISDRQKILSIQDDITKDKVKEEDVAGKLADLSDTAKKSGVDFSKTLGDQARTQNNINKIMGGSGKGIGKMVGGAVKLGFYFEIARQIAQKFAGQLDAIGKTFGSINVLGDDFQDTLMDSTVTATRLGGSVEDVAGITANLASNFGIGLDAAAGLSSKILDTSKAIGLSTDEAANLFGVLMQTSNLSAEQAERLAEGAFQLARANQVNPAQVLKDIAGSSETIALFTKGGADNIAEAAVQARRFGISLDTTAKIAEGLLDFESSIAKEVEASVLIGRQLNFQKAREAALDGDKVGVLKEVVKQLGSEEEFLKLNLIQRKAIADSVNMSVADMSKLVGETAKAGVQAKGFRDLFGAEGLSDFTLLMNELKATTVGLVNALGPGLMAISKVLNLLIKVVQPVIDLINFGFRGVSSVLDFVTDALPSTARPVNDLQVSQGGVSVISGPAGTFAPNPKDVVTAYQPSPMGNVSTGTPATSNGNISISAPQEIILRADGNDLVDRVKLGANYTNGRPGEGLVGLQG